jgi:hypothetical protein
MALQVIEMVTQDKPYVVLTSDLPQFNLAIVELKSADARNQAIKHAATQGITNARCEMPSAPYPVDLNGNEVTDPHKQKVASYRVAIPISTGL